MRRLISGHSSASAAIKRSTASISESRNSIWRSAASTDSRSSAGRSSSASQRWPLGPKGSANGGAAHQAAHQRGVNLVLRPRPRADQLGSASQPPAHHARPLVGHPDPIELARGEQPRERASVEPIGLCPRTADPGVHRGDGDHLGDVGLDDAPDRPGAAGHLQRDPVGRVQALSEQLELLRPGRDPSRGANLSTLRDRHRAEVDANVQGDLSHPLPPLVVVAEEAVGKRHRRIRARSATGQVAGAATEHSPGSKPIVQTGLPTLRSPRKPPSRSPDPTITTGRQPPG
jgi:hypothetical protein